MRMGLELCNENGVKQKEKTRRREWNEGIENDEIE